jgi:hypothetical protein
MRVALWVIIIALVVVGRASGDDRYIAAVAPLVIIVLWFAAPVALRSAVALSALALFAAWLGGADALLVDVLPIVIAALVGWLFARSLLGGREPLIARAIAAIDGAEPLADPAVRRYALGLTRLWAGCQFGLAAFGLLCVAHLHWTWPSWPLPTPRQFALILPLAVIVLFVAEFALRPLLLPQAPRKELLAFVRALAQAWPRLIEK